MPVYLFTIHAYRSWSEGNPKGYVQRDEGLKPSSPNLARWREENSSNDPARFDLGDQQLLHEILIAIANEKKCKLHAGSTTPTHVHGLTSFAEPACCCDGAEWCRRGCTSRDHMERFITLEAENGPDTCEKIPDERATVFFARLGSDPDSADAAFSLSHRNVLAKAC